ncbi:MAG: hypothetical protein HYX68_14290 [Planctomycetes bacterium]|nr:hypothetical protein [Planctomycetota bacterium]
MIWFTCKKCNKTHSRTESSAGTMIFCDCGQGLTVPWESTAAPPPTPAVVDVPRVPDLAPIQFDPVPITTPNAPPRSSTGSSYPSKPPPIDDERPYRRGRNEKRDPDFCFNHQRRPKVQTCAECEEAFCADCVSRFQGALLCGPCKNFRARRQELPPNASTMANASLIIPLITAPLMMCWLLYQPGHDAMRVLSFLSLLPQLLALGLGAWALYDAERERKGGGQWVAISGVTTATLTCVLMLLINLAATRLAAPA